MDFLASVGFNVTDACSCNGGPISGEFVLALKGGRYFSLFYFENYEEAGLDLETGMECVSENHEGITRERSHATVCVTEPVRVSEPGTVLLIALELAGRAVTRRREDIA